MLIFLDLETTGLEYEDRICSIGILAVQAQEKAVAMYELVNEGKKISAKASSIHHISNEMIASKDLFTKSEIYKFLQTHNRAETTIVAHNVNFAMQMLFHSGYEFKGKLVDTLRVARHLIPESESYSLQYLRYELKLYKEEPKLLQSLQHEEAFIAHHALSDACIVKLLYELLSSLAPADTFYELSHKYVLLQKFDFGKYAGRYIEEIAMNERSYLEWMLYNIKDMDEDLKYSIEYYLGTTN